ncbi:MAG: HupE/UreJ family protein [Bauldia sp.]|nr:MAG: HupE/UreJ family protein [Bauldia sp.]MBZ0227927.1 HupE/UreJ family protein [Bauldia sp.]
MFKRLTTAAVILIAATAPAFAHLDPTENGSFLAGFSHPMFGFDHILAMVAVGLWAATIGGRAAWIVPSSFVGMMVVGYFLSLFAVPLPLVEPMILASVVALGLLIAAAIRMPVAAGAVLAGLFALFHGYAHGGELGVAAALPFGVGFALTTALLHAAGIGTGLVLGSGVGLGEAAGKIVARVLGGVAAALGIALAFG